MNTQEITLNGATLAALPSGALFWPAHSLLCVSDLHLGKSERLTRRGGALLPPYETQDTLSRLEHDLNQTNARRVVCLGDSFDDLGAALALPEPERLWITRLQAGREWVWIEGNHDPGPVDLGGSHLSELYETPLTFRHIAHPGATGEISGHYHPKARIRNTARAAFLFDETRIIMPAYGTYTGGLDWQTPVLRDLMQPPAFAILTGPTPLRVPMPR
jgi:DNA ligase-associated metallophosphoesterase